MKNSLNKSQIERFSRQLVLKNIGAKGQKKILSSKVLIVGIGGTNLTGLGSTQASVSIHTGAVSVTKSDLRNWISGTRH